MNNRTFCAVALVVRWLLSLHYARTQVCSTSAVEAFIPFAVSRLNEMTFDEFRTAKIPMMPTERRTCRVVLELSSIGEGDTKERLKQLLRMSEMMGVNMEKLKELLEKQRSKLKDSDEKAAHIDWLLRESVTAKDESEITADEGEPAMEYQSYSERKGRSRIRRPIKPKGSVREAEERLAEARKRQAEALKDPTLLTRVEFAQRTDLHQASKRALTDVLGLRTMTEIQAKTYAAALSGKDILGRSRTGTGKTIAFLLPSVERLLRSDEYFPGRGVGILVVAPTRELASQIGDQAEKLLTYHSDLSVQVMYGGTKMGRDISQLSRRIPTVLVATPGRLRDHIDSTRISGRRFGDDVLSNTRIVVLDETDRLLDMGFRREVRKILSVLPRRGKRQTLLFSATIPPQMRYVISETLDDDFVEVDCIRETNSNEQTNQRAVQSYAILPELDRYVQSVVEVIRLAMQEDEQGHKIVVFFPTARIVGFFSDLFGSGCGIPVIELHSKKSQGYRNKASKKFREASSGILLTTDVSARGVDFPDVTHVIQFGMPDSREQYIHRLGRTARAGHPGKGWLVLMPFETSSFRELKGLSLHLNEKLSSSFHGSRQGQGQGIGQSSQGSDTLLQPALDRVRNGDLKLMPSAQMAYISFIGYYIEQMKRTKSNSKGDIIFAANEFARSMGLHGLIELPKVLVKKLELDDSHLTIAECPTPTERQNIRK